MGWSGTGKAFYQLMIWYWEGFLSTRCLMLMIAANPQIPECQALSHHLAYTGSLESHYPQNQCYYLISILLMRKKNHWQLERTPFLSELSSPYSDSEQRPSVTLKTHHVPQLRRPGMFLRFGVSVSLIITPHTPPSISRYMGSGPPQNSKSG